MAAIVEMLHESSGKNALVLVHFLVSFVLEVTLLKCYNSRIKPIRNKANCNITNFYLKQKNKGST